ncbi:MAG: hypothetical protein J6O39_07520 [Treponema sp.]|nr:hypothetical protein [Treponema sp.]
MKKISSIFLLSVISAFSVFAQDFSELDSALKAEDSSRVLSILENAGSHSDEFEQRVLDAAAELVMKGNVDLAADYTETVLLFDMDNKKAQEMYTAIEKARKDKIKEQQEAAVVAEKKKVEEKARRLQEYKFSVAEYYRSLKKVSYRNFPVEIGLIPLAFDYEASSFTETDSFLRYGFGGEVKAAFVHPGIKFDLNLDYIHSPVMLASGEGTKGEFNLRAAVTSPVFPVPLSLSAGYRNRTVKSNASLYKSISGPLIGIGVNDFELMPDFFLTAFFDLDLASSMSDSMQDFAFGAEVDFKYIFRIKPMLGIYVAEKNRFNAFFIGHESESYLDCLFSAGIVLNGR